MSNTLLFHNTLQREESPKLPDFNSPTLLFPGELKLETSHTLISPLIPNYSTGKAEWGEIKGDITDLTDLINYIDEKYDNIVTTDTEQTITSNKKFTEDIHIGKSSNTIIRSNVGNGELKVTHKGSYRGFIIRTNWENQKDVMPLEMLTTNGISNSYSYKFPEKSGNIVLDSDLKSKQDNILDLDIIRANASKGATALQNIPEEYITETELNDKGFLTEHQDISGKQDNLVSGTNIKTINNQSILGEGNINIASGKAEWGEIKGDITDLTDLINYIDEKYDNIVTTDTEQTITSNKKFTEDIHIGKSSNTIIRSNVGNGELKVTHKGSYRGFIIRTNWENQKDVMPLEMLTTNGISNSYSYKFPEKSGNIVLDSDLKSKQDNILDLDIIRANASKGATALQNIPEEYITETELNDKGFLTEHQDISGKQDNLVSGTNIKTINNQSILGEGNINIASGGMDEETLAEFNTLKNKMDILYKVSLALYGGKNVEVGTTQTVNLSWTIKVNGSNVNPGSQTISNGTTTETLGATVRNKTYTGVTTNTTYTLTVDGVTATANVKFYYPAYFGVVSSDYQVSGSTTGLTKLSNYGSKSYNATTSTAGYNKVVYMYPSSLGALTTIKDGNNFELLGSFTSSTVSIGGVSYYAYVITNATNTASQTFKFS